MGALEIKENLLWQLANSIKALISPAGQLKSMNAVQLTSVSELM